MRSDFLNVDLDVESVASLDLLVTEMGERVLVLYSGPAGKPKRTLLTVEACGNRKSPDPAIHALCTVVESLSPAAKRIWAAADKVFDVGYELRATEKCSRFKLRPDTLERVAKLGASLAVTYYRREEEAKLTRVKKSKEA